MTGGIGVLGTECGTEGVDLTESRGTKLAFELTGNGECGRLGIEVLGVIYLTLFILGEIVKVERGDLEHRSGSLAVTGRDEGCVEIIESSFVEELVDGKGK